MKLLDISHDFIFVTLAVWVTVLVSAEQRFAEQPRGVTVKHGRSVVLRCKVLEKKGIIQWTKDGFGLGTDTELVGFNRYKMEVDESQGIYNLHIRPVLVEDQANYQCQVGGADGERPLRSSIAKIIVHFPPNEDRVKINKASPVDTTEGTPIRLYCEAGLSSPAAKIKWFNNHKEIINGVNVSRYEMPNSILNSVRSFLDFTPKQEHHNNNITCKVSHVALEIPIERYVVMNVKYKPVVKIKVNSLKIKESEDVRLICEAQANPAGLRYRWDMDGETISGKHNTEFIIKDVSRHSNGAKIGCVVSNVVGSSSADHQLSIQYSPVFMREPSNVDADEGESVTLNCDVDSNPPPTIHWTHRKGSNTVINLGPTLKLEKLTRENKGSYFCWARVPGFSDVFRHIEVFMRDAPEIQAEANQFGMEGETIHVVCDIRGIPRPTKYDVHWIRHGVILNGNSSRYDILQESTRSGVRSTLLIHDAISDDFGHYNCTAKNGYGKDIGGIQLNRQVCQLDKELAIKIAFRESLPLVTTLVAIILGIIFIMVIMAGAIIFKNKRRGYKDPSLKKRDMYSHEDFVTRLDSVMKVEPRPITGSDLSPSEEGDDYSHNSDWGTSDTGNSVTQGHHVYGYMTQYNDATYPTKGSRYISDGYEQYVNYSSRDYNPPPPPPVNYNHNSIYSTAPLNIIDLRYSAAYGNPYLKENINTKADTDRNFHNTLPNSTLRNTNQNDNLLPMGIII